jgi:trigger factor
MNIQITSKKSTGVERLLEVSVAAADVRDAEETAAQRYATRVRLPGFRPGKAPTAMIRKKFADVIRQQAIETLIQEAYKEAIDREQLKPAAQPHVHDVKFVEGEPLTFELHLEVRPEIPLPRVSGFRVERTNRPVTDEIVAEQVEHMRDQRASLNPVEGKPAPGDHVTVLLATPESDGGELPAEGHEYRLVLGEGQAIPAIEELIMEAEPGQTVSRPVRWPDDFPDEAQRGKTKPVRVTLQDVKRKTLPPLDDAFAREIGDFDSLDALRKTVREDLEKAATREADAEVRQKLVDEIAAANPFDVPPSWVNQMVDAYGQAYQIPEEDRPKFAGEFKPVAERQVRRDLIIDTLAEREKLTASEADVDDKVAEVAAARKANVSEVYASLQKAGRLREIERGITEEKVFKWLLERNTVETK